MPWVTFVDTDVHGNPEGDAVKALLALADGARIETVLMRNRRDQWTVCVSSQVGCAMKCAFCATGKLGLERNLTADEIVDQVRFWRDWLASQGLRDIGIKGLSSDSTPQTLNPPIPSTRISNIVFMGMGEPMANYEQVKAAIKTILKHTDIGPTRITVSTSGVLPQLEALLGDAEWPDVRLAISLHSADPKTRRELMPTSYETFLDRLRDWALKYLAAKGGRRHHLTLEYVLLGGITDTPDQAERLARFCQSIGQVRVNLIPYNQTDAGFRASTPTDLAQFQETLEHAGVTVTVRKSLGQDIDAACGQLAGKK